METQPTSPKPSSPLKGAGHPYYGPDFVQIRQEREKPRTLWEKIKNRFATESQ